MNKDKFYIEDIFNLVEMQHKAIAINFVEESDDSYKYPFGITLLSISNYKLPQIANNINGGILNSGVIEGKGYDNQGSHPEVKVVFSTDNVRDIEKC